MVGSEKVAAAATEALAQEAVAWASSNGLMMVKPGGDGAKDPTTDVTFIHAPFSLLPNLLPRQEFDRAVALSPLMNLLVDRIASDRDWLLEAVDPVLESDPFTAKLVELMKATPPQRLRLGIHRSDFMFHGPPGEEEGEGGDSMPRRFLQIELNTIASSFGCISARVSELHRYLISRFSSSSESESSKSESGSMARALEAALESIGTSAANVGTADATSDQGGSWAAAACAQGALPENPTLRELPAALAAAHGVYGCKSAVVAFVVQPGERNVMDQRLLELRLWEDHQIQVRRLTLRDIAERGSLGGVGAAGGKPGSGLMVDQEEVAVVYFRAGYTPDDYPSEVEWEARSRIELSDAVKCPTLAYHLAGTKKVCPPA